MNEAETMTHLTDYVLPTALRHLHEVKCDRLDAFTLALAAWTGKAPESLELPSQVQRFRAMHLAACELVGEEPHAPDLRALDQRDDDALDALATAYDWAALAQRSHAKALRAGMKLRTGKW